MDRVEALKQVESICNLKTKVITAEPKTKIYIEPDNIIWLKPGSGGRQMEVTEQGMEQFSGFAHIPDFYKDNLTPATYATLSNELLTKKGKFTVILKDGKVNGFAKADEYRYIDPEKVLKTLEKAIPGADFDRIYPMDNNFSLMVDAVSDRRTDVRVGDPASAGASLTFSPISIKIPYIYAYIKRWYCLNGASAMEKLDAYAGGGGGGGEFFNWLNKNSRKAFHSVGKVLDHWRAMIEQTITPEDRAGVLAALIKEARMTAEEADAVMDHALEEPPATAYDIYNLVTWGASHVMTDPTRIMRARLAADEFSHTRTHAKICPICHRGSGQAALPPGPATQAG